MNCQYSHKEIRIHDYENRDPKTASVDYGLLTHIYEIKNNLGIGIGIGIVPNIAGYKMQDRKSVV